MILRIVKGMKVLIKVDKIAEGILSHQEEPVEEIQMRNQEKILNQLHHQEKRRKDIWISWQTKKPN